MYIVNNKEQTYLINFNNLMFQHLKSSNSQLTISYANQ